MFLQKAVKYVINLQNLLNGKSLKTSFLRLNILIFLGIIFNIAILPYQSSLASDLNKNLDDNLTEDYTETIAINSSVAEDISLLNPNPVESNTLQNMDGVYLYGQSPQPGQFGLEYLVFEVTDNKLFGAVYFPQSEFNCFYGTLTSYGMELSIMSPYENAVYPYSIALEDSSVVATTGNQVLNKDNPSLRGYYPINNLSQWDEQLLQMCQNSSSSL